MPPLIDAKDCPSMQVLRAQIDQLDQHLIDLLLLRSGYIDRAAELKPGEALPARIPDRVEEVVANVRAHAGQVGMDPALAERLWRILIDWSIAREEAVIGPD